MNDTQNEREREASIKASTAKIADQYEYGWPRTPAMQSALETCRTSLATPLDDDAPGRAADHHPGRRNVARDDQTMKWREDFATFLRLNPDHANALARKWERRCRREGLDLPRHLTGDTLEYTAECRKRYLDHRAEYEGTLMYACEILAEIGMGFERIRPLLDHHHVGSTTLAKIETLYAELVAEIAQVQTEPPR